MPDPQRTALLEEARFQLQHLDRALSYQLVGFPLTISLQREGIQQVADLLRGLLALVDEPRDWHPDLSGLRQKVADAHIAARDDHTADDWTAAKWAVFNEAMRICAPVSGAEPRATAPRRDEEHE